MRHLKQYNLPGRENRIIVKRCGRQIGAVLYCGSYGLAINDKPLIAALVRSGRFFCAK